MTYALILSALLAAASAQHAHPLDRAQHAMGFDQQKTTHHFLIQKNGGAIEITAKDPADAASTTEIRTHLRHIAAAFGAGDFSLPLFIHEAEPPGAPVMKERRAYLTYAFEEMPAGGRLVVRTSDAKALHAVHEFFRFQIREHRTGDPMNPRDRR